MAGESGMRGVCGGAGEGTDCKEEGDSHMTQCFDLLSSGMCYEARSSPSSVVCVVFCLSSKPVV